MPTMNECLLQSGFELAKPVGVIVEAETMSGDFMLTDAIYGYVLGSLPDECSEQYPNFDPEYCIAVYCKEHPYEKVAVFELLQGAEVYRIEPTGLLIWHDLYRVFFGQNADFFNRLKHLAKRLSIQR